MIQARELNPRNSSEVTMTQASELKVVSVRGKLQGKLVGAKSLKIGFLTN